MKLFSVSYYVTGGYDSASGTLFHTLLHAHKYSWWKKRVLPSLGSYCGARH